MIVVDSSALVAIALREPDRPRFVDALLSASGACLSPVNFAETGMVLWQRGFLTGLADLERLIARYGVDVWRAQHLVCVRRGQDSWIGFASAR